MVVAEALRALSLAGLLLGTATGQLSLLLLGALGFIGACGTVGFSVAAPALVPALVPRSSLGAANSRLELARSVAYAGGPALAGALVGWAGGGLAFGLATVLSMAAVGLLARLPEPPRLPAPPHHPPHHPPHPPAAGAEGRPGAGVAAPVAAAHPAHRGRLEPVVVHAAGGLCALRHAQPGAGRAGGGGHAGGLWRGHGAGRVGGAAHPGRPALRHGGGAGGRCARCWPWPPWPPACCGPPACWRAPASSCSAPGHPVDHQQHHAAPDRHAPRPCWGGCRPSSSR